MKYVINLILVLLILAFVYFLYASINEPIEFTNEKKVREKAVIERLKQLRTAQQIYRDITDSFANDFDKLVEVLKTDSIPIVVPRINPDEVKDKQEVVYDTTFLSAYDSIQKMNINLDSLKYIPYSNGKTFSIEADEIDYQKTKVNVVEVGARYKDFMGKYADKKYKKYETGYDPENMIKFGDINSPNLSGNWE